MVPDCTPFVGSSRHSGSARIFAWHIPAAYDAALRHPSSLIHVEHACYFVTGLLFWWPALQNEPHRSSTERQPRDPHPFAAFVLASPLGLLLALIPSAVYHFYIHAPRLWGLSPLAPTSRSEGAGDGARAGDRPLRRQCGPLPALPSRRGPRTCLSRPGPPVFSLVVGTGNSDRTRLNVSRLRRCLTRERRSAWSASACGGPDGDRVVIAAWALL